MSHLIESLSTEVHPELSDRRNEALHELLHNSYEINKRTVTFKTANDPFYSGTASFTSFAGDTLKALFSVYIFESTVYASLLSLDMVKLIDVPFAYFVPELQSYLTV